MLPTRSRRQVFLGLPLFCFPWGLHLSACLVVLLADFLWVCPIHPRLLRRISTSSGSWFVRCHKSALLMVTASAGSFSGSCRRTSLNFPDGGLRCPPCLCSIQSDWLEVRVEQPDLCACWYHLGAPDVPQLQICCPRLADSCSDICLCAALFVSDAAQVCEGLYLFQLTPVQCDWVLICCVDFEDLGLALVDLGSVTSHKCWWGAPWKRVWQPRSTTIQRTTKTDRLNSDPSSLVWWEFNRLELPRIYITVY